LVSAANDAAQGNATEEALIVAARAVAAATTQVSLLFLFIGLFILLFMFAFYLFFVFFFFSSYFSLFTFFQHFSWSLPQLSNQIQTLNLLNV
jgi:hypothetical protein